MTTTENTIAATTVARKYVTDAAVALFADMLQGTAIVLGTSGPKTQGYLREAFKNTGIDVASAEAEYGFLTRR